MDKLKEIAFTSEQQFDRNIHERLTPQFYLAIRDDDLSLLYKTVLSLYYTTSMLYRSAREEIKERIYEVELPTRPTTDKERAINFKRRIKAKTQLLDCWEDIFSQLDKIGFFKRRYDVDNSRIAVPKQ